MDIKLWNEYKEEQEMETQAKNFMRNVINKAQIFVYIKMIKDMYLEDMHQFLGIPILMIIIEPQIVLYSL